MKRLIPYAALAGMAFTLSACELGPKTSSQNGYRGTGMDTIKLDSAAVTDEVPAPPYTPPPATGGPTAAETYQNVQVLGDVSADQFNYTMAAITEWVAPKEGCNYCHNPANMASDEKYTKVAARRMLQMTRNINGNWTDHVAQTGVTCWTCHRGQAVPSEHWTMPAEAAHGIIGNRHGQDEPLPISANSSLPNTVLAEYLTGDPKTDTDIRVVSKASHPGGATEPTVRDAESTYAMMMHVSQSLGVNCSFCHNAQAFQPWGISRPQRVKAWYGIRMARDINGTYIGSLTDVFPANRKGPAGDPYKVDCATCHRGNNKPLGGYPMAKDYPALHAVAMAPAAPAPTDEGSTTTAE
jgi:photosynthetic reaction center cytochrome c subunit